MTELRWIRGRSENSLLELSLRMHESTDLDSLLQGTCRKALSPYTTQGTHGQVLPWAIHTFVLFPRSDSHQYTMGRRAKGTEASCSRAAPWVEQTGAISSHPPGSSPTWFGRRLWSSSLPIVHRLNQMSPLRLAYLRRAYSHQGWAHCVMGRFVGPEDFQPGQPCGCMYV